MMMRFFVDAIYLLAVVFILPIWRLKRALAKKRIAPTRARLSGFPVSKSGSPPIWIHGVSVGEIRAARGLIEMLEADRPGQEICLSVTTQAGYDVAKKEYGTRIVFFSPLDFSWVVRRAFDAVRPSALILMELELWPNLLAEAHRRSVPVIVANAKMSEKSARGYRRIRRLFPSFLEAVRLFCIQHASFLPRFRSIGLPDDRLVVTGVVKVDNLPKAVDQASRQKLREELGIAPTATVFLAGSTHPGEEEFCLAAFDAAHREAPNLQLLIAPRHTERTGAIVEKLAARGRKTVRRTEKRPWVDPESVFFLDTMGELERFFAVADIVFLGGSLVPVGGHNILEPAAQGRSVIFGPHVWTVGFFAEEMVETNAGFRVDGTDELARLVVKLAQDHDLRETSGARAVAMVDRHRGATRRTVVAIEKVIAVPSDR